MFCIHLYVFQEEVEEEIAKLIAVGEKEGNMECRFCKLSLRKMFFLFFIQQ